MPGRYSITAPRSHSVTELDVFLTFRAIVSRLWGIDGAIMASIYISFNLLQLLILTILFSFDILGYPLLQVRQIELLVLRRSLFDGLHTTRE